MAVNRVDPAGGDGNDVAIIAGLIDQVGKSGAGIVKYRSAAGAGRGSEKGIETSITTTAADTAYYGVPALVTSDGAINTQVYIYFPTDADRGSGNLLVEFYRIRSGTTGSGVNVIRWLIASNDHSTITPGTIYMQNSAGGDISTTNTRIVASSATWYRFELGAKPGTSTTGSCSGLIYSDADSVLYTHGHPAADLNLGTASPTRLIIGKIAGSGTNVKIYSTQAAVDTHATTIPTITPVSKNSTLPDPTIVVSPGSGPVPRVDGSAGTTYTITATSTGGNGNAKTYAIQAQYSANGTYSDAVTILDTTSAPQSSNVFTHQPTNAQQGKVRYRCFVYQT